ncbi:phosphocholine cytidylyltransferase family protein [Cohnella fermenti]|nr:phosphocholine cytidylyltransferase family protein [Cohnella fermenti]
MIRKAVIVAAGLSSRLYPLTLEQPKGLLSLNGEALLERSIDILKRNGITKIAVVVGYKKEQIIKSLGADIDYIFNPFYRECNNMGSLWFASAFIDNDPFLYLHGDIVYDESIIKNVLNSYRETQYDIDLVTDYGPVDEEAMKVKVNSDNCLIESNKQIVQSESAGEWTGIAYIRNVNALFNVIEGIMYTEGISYYDTHAFTKMVLNGYSVHCTPTKGQPWIEIDFLSDYEKAKEMFYDENL